MCIFNFNVPISMSKEIQYKGGTNDFQAGEAEFEGDVRIKYVFECNSLFNYSLFTYQINVDTKKDDSVKL